MVLELVCYVALFNEQITSLRNVTDYLSDAAVQRRRQSNAVTLSGQVCLSHHQVYDNFTKSIDRLTKKKYFSPTVSLFELLFCEKMTILLKPVYHMGRGRLVRGHGPHHLPGQTRRRGP